MDNIKPAMINIGADPGTGRDFWIDASQIESIRGEGGMGYPVDTYIRMRSGERFTLRNTYPSDIRRKQEQALQEPTP